ncbi:MAG: Hydrogenase accessory protein HypB [Candidatus Magnetoglobus multicellularis str. Araruama]|uniref:Hydrogenase accessory protein HypB n=1 Tax=Candidatus Magnetoglobus multicellularis str. Araruama TaxID=890399 RepID=A0A1V1PI69_9BACT|nr:MAG: Hydrogenase accessory protein HypB [Candidatus Magnetoglobus multicellularis str. Araruama]
MLDANQTNANMNRQLFADKGVYVLNVMSSPGSGKTTTLEKTLAMIKEDLQCAVIVGDICTTNDADRLSGSGTPAIQINTDAFGGDCHLTAHEVNHALKNLNLDTLDLLIIENVGNLVCPAEFDMGEDARAVILSVTEGEDKPLKYPLMFRESHIALLNKIDLLPYLDYDIALVKDNIAQMHPNMPVIEISAKSLDGFDAWITWLKNQVLSKK